MQQTLGHHGHPGLVPDMEDGGPACSKVVGT